MNWKNLFGIKSPPKVSVAPPAPVLPRTPGSSVEQARSAEAQADANAPFVDNEDGTVTDKTTGLIWQKDDDGQTRKWDEATEYANGLVLSGHSDWRLPTQEELLSLSSSLGEINKGRDAFLGNTQNNSEVHKRPFPTMKSSEYWT
jgi:hypothetical protein